MEKVVNPKFQEAFEKREKQKKEEELALNSPNNYYNSEQKKYMGLEHMNEKVFRIVGLPVMVREVGSDAKQILFSEVVTDNKKSYCHVVWKHIYQNGKHLPDPDWILTRVYKKVMEYKWVLKGDGSKNKWGQDAKEKVYVNKDTDVFKRVFNNRKEGDTSKIVKKFFPKSKVLLNVIDRHDNWCAENKHTKILSSNVDVKVYKDLDDQGNEQTKVIEFPQVGISSYLYDNLFDHFSRFVGDWNVLDAVVTKDKEKKSYSVFDCTDSRYVSDNSKELSSDMDLTDDELSYDRYDFDDLFKVCSYNKMVKRLGGLFKLCDENLGTSFYDELLDLAKKEKEEYQREKEIEKEALVESTPDVQDVIEDKIITETNTNVTEVSQQNSIPRQRVRLSSDVSNEVKSDVDPELLKFYPNFNLLSDEEKDKFFMTYEGIVDEYPKFKIKTIDGVVVEPLGCLDQDNCKFPNSERQTIYPSNITTCPCCGLKEE